MKPTKEQRKAAAAYTGSFQAHSLVLHLLFNEIANLLPVHQRLGFKESIRTKARNMLENAGTGDLEDVDLVKEAGHAELANILSEDERKFN